MSVYARLLEVLSDGEWHGEDELRPITPFTREWIAELRHDGHEVTKDPSGAARVRLRQEPALA
jgi:hypothetical protein